MAKFYSTQGGQYWEVDGDKKYLIPAQSLHHYWRNPDFENVTKDYQTCPEKSVKLVSLFDKFCSKDDKILELGCNVGRNLHYLHNAGYKNLTGLDINGKALELGRELYPDTVAKLPLVCSSIEDYFAYPNLEHFDVIFTMAVLMHIHPSSVWIMGSMVVNADKYIITAEDEIGVNERVIRRNYKDLFEQTNMKQVHEEYIEYKNDIDDTGTIKLTYRVFKK